MSRELTDKAKAIIFRNKDNKNKMRRELRAAKESFGKKGEEFLQEISIQNLEKFAKKEFYRKFFFNFRGGWYFDLLENRDKNHSAESTDDGITPYFAVFLNGNSKYVIAIACNSKSEDELNEVYAVFKNECSHLPCVDSNGKLVTKPYPIVKVVSDAEAGWHPNDPDVEFVKHEANENHRTMGLINNFASTLRSSIYRERGTKSKGPLYISQVQMRDFCKEWNSSYIVGYGCTRAEMMGDPALEEAYIASCLYQNDSVDKHRNEMVNVNDEFLVEDMSPAGPFDNPQRTKLLKGQYKVVSTGGGFVELQRTDLEGESSFKVPYAALRQKREKQGDYKERIREIMRDIDLSRPQEVDSPPILSTSSFRRRREQRREVQTVLSQAATLKKGREVLSLNKSAKEMGAKTSLQYKNLTRREENEQDLIEACARYLVEFEDAQEVNRGIAPDKTHDAVEKRVEDAKRRIRLELTMKRIKYEHLDYIKRKRTFRQAPRDVWNLMNGKLDLFNTAADGEGHLEKELPKNRNKAKNKKK